MRNFNRLEKIRFRGDIPHIILNSRMEDCHHYPLHLFVVVFFLR
jgi:hypothetical protein